MGLRQTLKKRYSLKLLILIWVWFLAGKCTVFALNCDKSVLLELKNSFFDPSGMLSSWNSTDYCSWYGVSCDSNHFVIALNITGGGNSCGGISGFGINQPCSNYKSSIQGKLSSAIAKLIEIRILVLPFNELDGEIPKEIWGMKKLEVLDLEGNSISGSLPVEFNGMKNLRVLNLGFNSISGNIPISVFVSSLRFLNLAGNQLNGSIPKFGLWSRNLKGPNCEDLEYLDLSGNYFTGEIPGSLGNCGRLRSVLLYSNFLVGRIPSEFGLLNHLEVLDLSRNSLSGAIPPEIGISNRFISSCKNLRYLDLSSNKLTGRIPKNLPVPCMELFDVSSNSLSGPIPKFFQNVCTNVVMPVFDDDPENLPSSYLIHFARRSRILKSPIDVYKDDVGRRVVVHDFGNNYFTGPLRALPIADQKKQTVLYVFSVANNNLSGQFPRVLFDRCREFSGLVVNISKNGFTGQIPGNIGIEGCSSLRVLDGSGNRLTGSIPASTSRLDSLEVLELSWNFLTGEIPKELANLRNLTVLRLDSNRLSGQIPSGLSSRLLVLNVSYNNLSGPNEMKCSNNVLGNRYLALCHHMFSRRWTSENQQGSVTSPEGDLVEKVGKGGGLKLNSIEIALISSASAIFSVLVALVAVFIYTRKCGSRSRVGGGSGSVKSKEEKVVTVFKDIGFPLSFEKVVNATGNFNVSNCIGNGGFGATYKAEIVPGVLVAIKRLAVGRFIQGFFQQFDTEIKTLGNIHHPNLVTLVGYHASQDEMFLIYNYLPGGNLEKFIQDKRGGVNWRVLHKIALDVARALAYLHDQCVPRILHRDVKPSNILLDEELNAYLSDFGLARLLGTSETHATTGVAGTFGYVAPEYAMTCRVSDKADVYSYGVVLLELISDKKALDPSFSPYGNGFNIVTWAGMLLRQGRAKEFFAAGLWETGPHDDLVDVLHLAVSCTDSHSTRPTMKLVVRRLKRIQPPPARS